VIRKTTDADGDFRILVVEDDPSIRCAMERGFRRAGYHAEFATNLQEGLSKLDRHSLVLCDLRLPDGSGITLLRKIRQEARPIRIAIYSGLLNARELVDASGERPDAVFQKPMKFGPLLKWITGSRVRL
jgi:DNA-binding response OmpR family regulator